MKFPWHPDTVCPNKPARLKNFLNGEWVEARRVKEVINPLTGETIILMPDTQEEELKPFIDSLARCPKYGLHNPLYNVERYRMYGDICRDAARFLRGRGGREYFIKLINLVMPKGYDQCAGEVDVVASFLETFSGNGVRNLAKGVTTPGNHDGEQPINYRWPYGPVAVITPFNFPLEIMALQLMGALFMGNKPILKQSSTTSIVAEAFVRLLLQCGMPKDDMRLIHCSGSVMEKVVTWGMPHPVVQLTQFTGGSDVAHRLWQLTGGRCKVEDAGFDWKIVGSLAEKSNSYWQTLKEIARICDKDAYAAYGQKCSAQSILFICISDFNHLVEEIKNLAAKRNLQDLSIGPVLTWNNQQIQEHIDRLLTIEGSKLLFGGKPISEKHFIPECYGSYEPTAVYVPLEQILPNFELVTTEVFGPLQIITLHGGGGEDLDLILEICNKMENHLTAGVVSNDPEFLNYVLGRTINGTTYAGIRGRTTGAPEWHFFGPAGHPAGAGIGTPEAIINTWSQNRTIIYDTKEF